MSVQAVSEARAVMRHHHKTVFRRVLAHRQTALLVLVAVAAHIMRQVKTLKQMSRGAAVAVRFLQRALAQRPQVLVFRVVTVELAVLLAGVGREVQRTDQIVRQALAARAVLARRFQLLLARQLQRLLV